MDNFVQLNVTTCYSFGQSICRIEDIIQKAKQYGMQAVAKTDWGKTGLWMAENFRKECQKNGIHPIVGIKIKLCDMIVILLVKNENGYAKLTDLCNNGNVENLEEILKLAGDCVCIVKKIRNSDKKIIFTLKQVFDDDFYWAVSTEWNSSINAEIEDRSVVADEVCYPNKSDYLAFDIYRKIIQEKNKMELTCLDEATYFRNYNEIIDRYKAKQKAIERTNEIAEKCIWQWRERDYIHYDNTLFCEIKKGILNRGIDLTDEVMKRLETEWNVFSKNNQINTLSECFKLVSWAKRDGIYLGSGRGNICSSLIAFALGITEVNPLKYGLIFERIPSKIDITFETDISGKLRMDKHCRNTYGNRMVRLGSIIKLIGPDIWVDTAKALGMSEEFCVQLMALFMEAKKDLPEGKPLGDLLPVKYNSIYVNQEFIDLIQSDKNMQKIADLVLKIECLPYALKPHQGTWVLTEVDNNLLVVTDVEGQKIALPGQTDLYSTNVIQWSIIARRNITDIVSQLDFASQNIEETALRIAMDSFCYKERKEKILYLMKNPDKIHYLNEIIKPYILKTYGMLVYQEQLMEILHDIGEYTYKEAYEIYIKMKHLAAKDDERNWLNRCINKGISKDEATEIWLFLNHEANYVYLKAHFIAMAQDYYKVLRSQTKQ